MHKPQQVRQANLTKGQSAPFAGTLFDPVATAKILAAKETQRKLCESKSKYEKDLLIAKCKRTTDLLGFELKIENRKNNLIIAAQKEEIEVLRNLAKGSNTTLWATIGFLVGTGASIAIFYTATGIVK